MKRPNFANHSLIHDMESRGGSQERSHVTCQSLIGSPKLEDGKKMIRKPVGSSRMILEDEETCDGDMCNSAISSFTLHNITPLITLATQYKFYGGGTNNNTT